MRISRRRGAASLAVACLIGSGCGSKLDDTVLRSAGPRLVAESRDVLAGASRRGGVAADIDAPGTGASGGARVPAPSDRPGSSATRSAIPAAKPEVVLGTFGTGSGIVGAQLRAIPVAVRAWTADVNARGGLGGHPVRMVYGGDDGGDPGRALAIARHLVEEQHIIALFGHYAATTIHAVIPYLEERGIPVIGAQSNTLEDYSPVVFNPRTGPDLGIGRSLIVNLIAQTRARKVSMWYCREAAACANAGKRVREYAPKVGVEIVHEANSSFAAPDYTAEVVAARRAGAEALLMFFDYASILRIIRSANRQGWRPLFVASTSIVEEDFVAAAEDDIGEVLGVTATVPYPTSPKLADYLAAVRRYVPGGAFGATGAGSWVAGKLLESVGDRLGDRPTSRAIIEALLSLRREALGGLVSPLTFPRGKDRSHVNLCIVPVKFTGGRFVAPFGDTFYCGFDDGVRRL